MHSFLRLYSSLLLVTTFVVLINGSPVVHRSKKVCVAGGEADLQKCKDQFDEELRSVDDERAKCCSLTHFRMCVVNSVCDIRGDYKSEVVDMIMKPAIKKLNDDTDCKDYDSYRAEFACLSSEIRLCNDTFKPHYS